MNINKKIMCAPIAILTLIGSLIGGANGAIVAGTKNSSGSWIVNGITYELGFTTGGSFNGTIAYIGGDGGLANHTLLRASGDLIFRRESNFSFSRFTNSVREIYSEYDTIGSSINDFSNGAIEGSNNFILLSRQGFTEDTVLQLSLDSSHDTITGDSIIGLWYDDDSSDGSIAVGISSFEDLPAIIPEPSSALLLGLSALAIVVRRKRLS